MEQDIRKWKELGAKEKSQLILAYIFGCASVLLGFISFIWLSYVPTSVIAMSALWASVCCGILGISLYFKNQLVEFQSNIKDRLRQIDDMEENLSRKLNNLEQ